MKRFKSVLANLHNICYNGYRMIKLWREVVVLNPKTARRFLNRNKVKALYTSTPSFWRRWNLAMVTVGKLDYEQVYLTPLERYMSKLGM